MRISTVARRLHKKTKRDEIRDSRSETEPASQVSQARRLFDSRTPILAEEAPSRHYQHPLPPSGKRYIAVLGYFQRLQPEYRRMTASFLLESGCPRVVQYPRPSNRPGACPCLPTSHIAHPNLLDPFPLPEADAGDSAFSFVLFQVLVAAVDTGHSGQDPDRPRQAFCQAAQLQCARPPSHGTTDPTTDPTTDLPSVPSWG
jgi:hypothetical protein